MLTVRTEKVVGEQEAAGNDHDHYGEESLLKQLSLPETMMQTQA